MKKILLIDDHVIVRSGIKTLLTEIYNDSEIDEANNGDSALEKVKGTKYDFVMLDIQMPQTDTFGLMENFRINYPALKVLVFSMSSESLYARRLLKAGAKGFISKNAPLEEIKRAINLVMNGQKYVSETVIDLLTEGSENQDNSLFNSLSPREFEIASLLLKGETISKIANSLNLKVSTVGTHKAKIFKKLRIANLLELKKIADFYYL